MDGANAIFPSRVGGGGVEGSVLPQLGLSLDFYTNFPLSY